MTDTYEYVNMRSFLWWLMRDSLNPDNPDAIALDPDDNLLTGDLTAPTYFYTSRGLIQIESKDDIRRRLKRSTDGADSLSLALFCAHVPDVEGATIKFTSGIWDPNDTVTTIHPDGRITTRPADSPEDDGDSRRWDDKGRMYIK
jgi:hypothetical protein